MTKFKLGEYVLTADNYAGTVYEIVRAEFGVRYRLIGDRLLNSNCVLPVINQSGFEMNESWFLETSLKLYPRS